MFTVYYANQLNVQKKLLVHLLNVQANHDPFKPEIILVQNTGMAQWLQMEIADEIGISGNFHFPFPASFFWELYRQFFPQLPKEDIFSVSSMTWRLMRIIPQLIRDPIFFSLKSYLTQDNNNIKLFQLATQLAELFDHYLIYRPNWIIAWENDHFEFIINEIKRSALSSQFEKIEKDIKWQGVLWNSLKKDISFNDPYNIFHRAYLPYTFMNKLEQLTDDEKNKLPKRISVFGISSLPPIQLNLLQKLSDYCDVHLFFFNPSKIYWGDAINKKTLDRLILKNKLPIDYDNTNENSLLSLWGKQGKDFLSLLLQYQPNEIEAYQTNLTENTNLNKLKENILYFNNVYQFKYDENDISIQVHSCHSILREVEVLHNYLLHLFENDNSLEPKDIIVMSADINKYIPYIKAVFSRYRTKDNRYIPFSISDQDLSTIDPILASFLKLLSFANSKESAEDILHFLNVEAISKKYNLNHSDIGIIREWIDKSGIRFGIETNNEKWMNYNSWENGLTRLLLGIALTEENGIWQNSIGFNENHGLMSKIVGELSKFISVINNWKKYISQPRDAESWYNNIKSLIHDIYIENNHTINAILYLYQLLDEIFDVIFKVHFEDKISIDVIYNLIEKNINNKPQNTAFLTGKVNFCTLLPMRAIPFKVVCLLGMNENEYPRQDIRNSFDLIRYSPQKGDRSKRESDKYLFFEALLSAQNIFYISYIGQSLINNQTYLPSILVSQLIDYLNQNNENATHSVIEITHHPMTIFSIKNFQNNYICYDKEWNIERSNKKTNQENFLNLSYSSHIPTEIELDTLIQFIQDPIHSFFNKILSVSLKDNDNYINENEYFSINGLNKFDLVNRLLPIETTKIAHFFKKEKLKGKLPLGAFAEVFEQKIYTEYSKLKSLFLDYEKGEKIIIPVKLDIYIGSHQIKLVGNIPDVYTTQNETIIWRIGELKDKYYIKTWIYHLIMKLMKNNYRVKCYAYNSQNKLISLHYEYDDLTEIESMLANYIQHYLSMSNNFEWGVSYNIKNYIKNSKNLDENNISSYCKAHLKQTLSQNRDLPYLERIINESHSLDYYTIHKTTLDWFSLMVSEHKITAIK